MVLGRQSFPCELAPFLGETCLFSRVYMFFNGCWYGSGWIFLFLLGDLFQAESFDFQDSKLWLEFGKLFSRFFDFRDFQGRIPLLPWGLHPLHLCASLCGSSGVCLGTRLGWYWMYASSLGARHEGVSGNKFLGLRISFFSHWIF